MDINNYDRVYKLAMKEYRNKTMHGEWPYLWVLDEILSHTEVLKEVDLGLVDIPLDQIRGTKTEGRTQAFAANFMPLLPQDSEFAYKWCQLYDSHLEEGIHDPIKAYEFLNQFYVLEGNKRVSVLKYCGAVSVPGNVTRIVPKPDDSEENRIYYEFMDFYDKTQINYINFSQVGSYPSLLKKMKLNTPEDFTDERREFFHSAYIKFSTAFSKKGGGKLSLTPSDAFLLYLDLYELADIKDKSSDEIGKEIDKIWSEFVFFPNKPEVKLIMDSDPAAEKKTLTKKITTLTSPTKVAFIHTKTAESSSWTYGHDLGANHVMETMSDTVEVSSYFGADTQEKELELFDSAVKDGNTIIFSTSAKLVGTAMKYALDYPKLHFLNCSINTNSKYIRTYYGRLYEAKFLIGAIAGVLSPTDEICYTADYPIYGGIANINAFALGAKMVHPDIKVYIRWPGLKSERQDELLAGKTFSYISGTDFIRPDAENQKFGLYNPAETIQDSLAAPVWNWGVFYEQTIKAIQNGTWKSESSADKKNETLNDWWGMSSGLIDVIVSKKIPPETLKMIDLLKKGICSGEFDPFTGMRYSKDGTHYVKVTDRMSAEQIITMDWLAENVIGFIPTMAELSDDAKPIVNVIGVQKVKDTDEKK
ncbi:MAG: BMP family ABC transporter substrate-binding protein [Eubacterium sp.]|nr:BMP family ABC transporter substrate-binding protein [Eubacterium sp.]